MSMELDHLIKGLKNDLKVEKESVGNGSILKEREKGASMIVQGYIKDLIKRLENRDEDLVQW